jgi:hypothetical protein
MDGSGALLGSHWILSPVTDVCVLTLLELALIWIGKLLEAKMRIKRKR